MKLTMPARVAAVAAAALTLAMPALAATPAHAATVTKTACTGWSQVAKTAVYFRACTTVTPAQSGHSGFTQVKVQTKNLGAYSHGVRVQGELVDGQRAMSFDRKLYMHKSQSVTYGVGRTWRTVHGKANGWGQVSVIVAGKNYTKVIAAPTVRY